MRGNVRRKPGSRSLCSKCGEFHNSDIRSCGAIERSIQNMLKESRSQVTYNTDSRDGLASLKSSSVDLIWTSPPYKVQDGYSDVILQEIARQLYRVAKKKTLCFVNFGCLQGEDDPFRIERLRNLFLLEGWKWKGYPMTVVWWKNSHFTPLAGNNLNNLWEWMYIFHKEEMPDLDRKLVPYADQSNAERFGNPSGLRCPGNVWPIDYETTGKNIKKPHKDSCPLELVRRSIMLAGLKKNSLIADPFLGGGTTLRVANELGHRFVGWERNGKDP